MKKGSIFKILVLIIMVLVITTISSFAYFSANISGGENNTTLLVSGGTMNITYSGGSAISLGNIYSRDTEWATKSFTLTGNNTTKANMDYNISLVVNSNTFSDNAIAYNLTLTSKTGEGITVPESSESMCHLLNGPQTEVLGNGMFNGPTGGNKTHTYSLKMYFPDTEVSQNKDQGKIITAYIKTEGGTKIASKCKQLPTIGDIILANNGGKENIIEAPTSLFNSISASNENKMYKMEDDHGTSYYFRGAKNYVNNNLIFANHQWKIIRINGDGTLRIIYNGTCPGNSCTINSEGGATHMILPSGHALYNSSGTTAYNLTNANDNKYLGYMYGGANGVASTSRMQATTNETSTNIKSYLDAWYDANINGTDYARNIADTIFCNDRQLRSEVGGPGTGTGFGVTATYYAAHYRLNTTKTPTLKCANSNNRFTTLTYNNISVPGNNALTYPIGLITADEGALAGLKYTTTNTTNYLSTNENYWTISPCKFDGSSSSVWQFNTSIGIVENGVRYTGGARGVVNLASKTPITGAGTALDPYVVQGL